MVPVHMSILATLMFAVCRPYCRIYNSVVITDHCVCVVQESGDGDGKEAPDMSAQMLDLGFPEDEDDQQPEGKRSL